MNLVFEVGHGEEEIIPLKLIPFVMCGTWITHIFGGSAGREGVAVQIGATVSHWIGRHIPIKNAPNIFLVVGMAAGFSGLFRTPIAAVFFAMEVLVAGELKYEALFPSLVASFTASQTSKSLGLEKFTFYLSDNISFQPSTMIKLLVLGMIFGLVGGFFAWALKQMKQAMSVKLPNPIIRIAVIGIILVPLFIFLHGGRYCGLGTNLINASFAGDTIYAYDWLLKLAFTILTLAAGFQGGEVIPPIFNWIQHGCDACRYYGIAGPICSCSGICCFVRGRYKHLVSPGTNWGRSLWIYLSSILLYCLFDLLCLQSE